MNGSDDRHACGGAPGIHVVAKPIVIRQEDCIECAYLGICHGGCPV